MSQTSFPVRNSQGCPLTKNACQEAVKRDVVRYIARDWPDNTWSVYLHDAEPNNPNNPTCDAEVYRDGSPTGFGVRQAFVASAKEWQQVAYGPNVSRSYPKPASARAQMLKYFYQVNTGKRWPQMRLRDTGELGAQDKTDNGIVIVPAAGPADAGTPIAEDIRRAVIAQAENTVNVAQASAKLAQAAQAGKRNRARK